MQTDAIEKVFEPQLKRLNLGRDQITEQTLEQLFHSLEAVADAMKHPESFGTIRLKVTAELGIIVTKSHAESHLEVGILPLLIERKQQINDRITLLGGKVTIDQKKSEQNTIAVKPIFSPVDDLSRFKSDVFVIMPFAKQFEAVFTDAIKPTCQELSLTVKRGDDFFTHHNIMDEIWFAIYASKLVIADCTGRNPNVYYELVFRHKCN